MEGDNDEVSVQELVSNLSNYKQQLQQVYIHLCILGHFHNSDFVLYIEFYVDLD